MVYPFIMRVCWRNNGRSRIVAAYLRELLTGRARVISAGTEPADGVNPIVIETMHDDGYDLSHAVPLRVHPDTVSAAGYAITMGCLPDPARESIDTVREILNRIKAKPKGSSAVSRSLNLPAKIRLKEPVRHRGPRACAVARHP